MPAATLDPVLRYLRSAAAPGAAALSDGQLLERFAVRRDQAAFTALVRRHGPLVLGVCRRVLGDWHAAQDAFQATFLVLARKAGALAQPELLPQWLHGVACRTAARARADAARRRARESRAAVPPPTAPDEAPVWRDLRPVLDEEIGRLPARHRTAVVLCYLEGRTNAEAARRLGCSRGTVATLLARARERLRRQLTRRGLGVPAVLTAAALAGRAAASSPSAALEVSTVQAAVAFAATGTRSAAAVSARAASLAEGVAGAMMAKKLKVVATVLFLIGLAGAGVGLATRGASAEGPTPAAAPPQPSTARGLPAGNAAPPVAAAPPATPPLFAVIRTRNFRIKAPTPEIADEVGRAAERSRKALALLWLGRELPAWPEPCPIEVKPTMREAAGATAFQFDKNGVVSQRMHLEGPFDRILADLLPHEVTHVVLAHWAGRPIPRWADEGAAILSESVSSRARHERALREELAAGRTQRVRRLLAQRDFPREVVAFYAQGYSLTDFLVQANGRAKFLRFMAEGDKGGWDRAAKTHYGYGSVDEMETAWLAHARKALREAPVVAAARPRVADGADAGGEPPAPTAGRAKPGKGKDRPQGRLPAGPAPLQALVAPAPGGRLTVWRTQTAMRYVPTTTYNQHGQPVTSYFAVLHGLSAESYDLEDVRAYDTHGKELSAKELAGLLKGETVALVAVDDRPVDPLHLRLLKEGTLTFVLPGRVPPAAPAMPAALAPPPPTAPAVVPPGPLPPPAVAPPLPPQPSQPREDNSPRIQ